MNGWDYPTYLALALTCLALQQWLAHGSRFSLNLVLDVFTVGVALGALSYLLFLPFYFNFLSPAQGLGLVNAQNHSPLNDEFLIFGLFAFIFVSLLLVCVFHPRSFPVRTVSSDSQGTPVEGEKSKIGVSQPAAGAGWLNGRLIAVLVILFVALGLMLIFQNSATLVVAGGLCASAAILTLYHLRDRARAFVLLLGAIALALIAFCEVIYLKDAFAGGIDFRMNTVFKFYYQAWMLFSVACGSGIFFLIEAFWPGVRDIQHLRQRRSHQVRGLLTIPWAVSLTLLLLASLTYPILAPSARLATYNNQTQTMGMTPTWGLDGLTYLQTCQPPDLYPSTDSDPSTFCLYNVTHDYAAIRWINANIQGDPIIVEAANASNEDYSLYALVSSFTGLPTIMGWPGHEVQWRLNWLQNQANLVSFNQRLTDINTIYTSPDPQIVLGLMREYHAEYLYVGAIEHAAYSQVDLTRFASFMQTVYSQSGVAIYKLPPS
jgi:YYY domain-containing protein